MEKIFPKVAVNVLVIRDGKVLLGKRIGAGTGTWGLPGGHLDSMESLTECAARELLEETGLRAEKLSFLHIVNHPLPEDDSHYVHIEFLAEGVKGEPELKEPNKCSEWKWFDLNALPENIFIGHKKAVPAYLENKVFID